VAGALLGKETMASQEAIAFKIQSVNSTLLEGNVAGAVLEKTMALQ